MTKNERPLIVYYSGTGQTIRLIDKINPNGDFDVQRIRKGDEYIDREYILVTPTYFKGQIPRQVQKLLDNNRPPIEVIGTGNKQWGKDFCGAGVKIANMFNIPLIAKVEQAGHFNEVSNILQYFTRKYQIMKVG